jgi:glucosamine 6-phosphate synthetase-like amidotransferase/phosphosugar isomerase protein
MTQRGQYTHCEILSIAESDADVTFESGLLETLRGALYLPVGRLMAFERATKRGLDPDTPHNLTAVVRLGE